MAACERSCSLGSVLTPLVPAAVAQQLQHIATFQQQVAVQRQLQQQQQQQHHGADLQRLAGGDQLPSSALASG